MLGIKNSYQTYIITFFLFSFLNCEHAFNSNLNKLKTIDSCYLSLGSNYKSKEFVLNFPFTANQLINYNWRCTGSEPFCATFGGQELEVTICHKFHNLNLYYNNEINKIQNKDEKIKFINSNVDLSKQIQMELEREINFWNHMYSIPCQFEELPRNWKDEGDVRTKDFGFIQKNGKRKYFMRIYTAITYEEYFNLEFTSSSNKIDSKFMQDEIQFIIDNLKGKPMHNN